MSITTRHQQPVHPRRGVWGVGLAILVFFVSTIAAALVYFGGVALTSNDYAMSHLYLFGTGGQLAMDALPITLLLRLRLSWLGTRRQQAIGAAVGLGGGVLLGLLRYALKGQLIFMQMVPAFGQSLALTAPWNALAAAFTILAYGPGEALIQVYLIQAIDEAIGQEERLISLGVILNMLLWGMGHIGNVVIFGWSAVGNAVLMLGIGVIIGVMFKKTRSAIAPMIFWTLVNGTSA